MPYREQQPQLSRRRKGWRSAHRYGFFDRSTPFVSYIFHDTVTPTAAVIDSVCGFDPATGRANQEGIGSIIAQQISRDGAPEDSKQNCADERHSSDNGDTAATAGITVYRSGSVCLNSAARFISGAAAD
ncbi:hypothetical protein BH09PSE3_BH09PSE3_25770 [soil metagenome]